uniref:(northern house mosquito) hypothetical protein n=1 Tax=Culex pipiens TaxID=7175 RepID=A0A8D8F2K0_CULPI
MERRSPEPWSSFWRISSVDRCFPRIITIWLITSNGTSVSCWDTWPAWLRKRTTKTQPRKRLHSCTSTHPDRAPSRTGSTRPSWPECRRRSSSVRTSSPKRSRRKRSSAKPSQNRCSKRTAPRCRICCGS